MIISLLAWVIPLTLLIVLSIWIAVLGWCVVSDWILDVRDSLNHKHICEERRERYELGVPDD